MEHDRQLISVSVDTVSGAEWDDLLAGFADASIYQSAAYGAARWGRRALSHLVVRQGDRVLAAAQVRIVKPPLLPVGIAYVSRGPAWCPAGASADLDTLRAAARALRDEYAVRRGLFLRVVPNLTTETEHPAQAILREEGYEEMRGTSQTIEVDLAPSIEELRNGLRRHWRHALVKAEKVADVAWIEGTEPALYDEVLQVYRQMHHRKQFAESVDWERLRFMQTGLPEPLKMRILVGRVANVPIAGIAWATFGDTGVALVAATGSSALENGAAYVMWWRMVVWLKENGFRACDLGGVNSERNPGGYIFKSGLGKKHGREVRFVGAYDCCTGVPSSLAFRLARWGMACATDWKRRAARARGSLAAAGATKNGTPPRDAEDRPPDGTPESGAQPTPPGRTHRKAAGAQQLE